MTSSRVGILGKVDQYHYSGSFGSVVMVKRKNSKSDKVYAMKIIDKGQIKETNLLQTDYM
jgi:hypothetical protein